MLKREPARHALRVVYMPRANYMPGCPSHEPVRTELTSEAAS